MNSSRLSVFEFFFAPPVAVFLDQAAGFPKLGLEVDEEIIHEQLPDEINGDHRRRCFQIRHLHPLPAPQRLDVAELRPHLRQHDAIVERLRSGAESMKVTVFQVGTQLP